MKKHRQRRGFFCKGSEERQLFRSMNGFRGYLQTILECRGRAERPSKKQMMLTLSEMAIISFRLPYLARLLSPKRFNHYCVLMNFEEARKKLASIGESHILENWENLSFQQKQNLLKQIALLDEYELKKQQEFLKNYDSSSKKQKNYTPFSTYSNVGLESTKDEGLKLISEGKVGCLLVAGGQGSRLGFSGPKGLFPITAVQNKTLFEVFAEKTVAAGKLVNRPLQLAIMTSPQNHIETVAFFEKNNYFGLLKEQVDFFSQKELPLLDSNGHLLLTKEKAISQGPDGNGSSLVNFMNRGILDKWEKLGIEYVNFVLIDNPLADPFDAALIGYHKIQKAEITIKCIERNDPEESVGIIVNTNEGVRVIEYSELDTSEQKATSLSQGLKHKCTNISLFCFSLPFIKKATNQQNLNWHLAYKNYGDGDRKGWKFETFIFDFLAYTTKIKVLMYPRNSCFAPLKNGSGNNSRETVREALRANDRRILEEITGCKINSKKNLELHQQFYYPTKDLLAKWKNLKAPQEGYIVP